MVCLSLDDGVLEQVFQNELLRCICVSRWPDYYLWIFRPLVGRTHPRKVADLSTPRFRVELFGIVPFAQLERRIDKYFNKRQAVLFVKFSDGNAIFQKRRNKTCNDYQACVG